MNARHHTVHHEGFPKPPAPAVYKKIAYTFLAITLVVVVGALWISSVRAQVTVTVKHDTTSVNSAVEISKSPDQGQLQGSVVEGNFEKIQEFSVEQSNAATVDTAVSGVVTITNNYSQAQTLIKTTRLSTPDGRIYRIQQTVTLQPKTSMQVQAVSDGKGASYVLSPGMKLTIPGLWIDLQKWIYATTVSGFSTGTASNGSTVSSVDITNAQNTLQDAILEQAKKELRAEAGVPDDWDGVYTDKQVDQKSNVTPGQSADQFMASVKLDVTGVFYPSKEMQSLVMQKLTDGLPEGKALVGFDPSQVNFNIDMADPTLEKARLTFSVQAESRLTENSPSLAKDLITGLPIDDAKSKLLAVDGVQDVQISIEPSWISKLPTMPDHIEMIIQ